MGRTTHIRVNVNGIWYNGLKVKVPAPRRRCVTKKGKQTCWEERQITVYLPKDFASDYIVVLPYEAMKDGIQEDAPQ